MPMEAAEGVAGVWKQECQKTTWVSKFSEFAERKAEILHMAEASIKAAEQLFGVGLG